MPLAWWSSDIIAGDLAPGARLGIVDLVQRYEIGATPLREGLSRLISRGLIVGIGQRGFRVADVSREDLEDITQMRTVIEVEALRLAIARGDDAWEAGILSALHQMRRHIQRTGDRVSRGGAGFRRAAQGISHRSARGLRVETAADGTFGSLRSGLSLSSCHDARLGQRRGFCRGASESCGPGSCARCRWCTGHAQVSLGVDAPLRLSAGQRG